MKARAHTFQASAIDLSFSYDTLTLYLKKSLDLTYHYQFIFFTLKYGVSFPALSQIFNLYEQIKHDSEFEEIVDRGDHDHSLNHHDDFDLERHHSHLKFKSLITHKKMTTILALIIQYHLLTEKEAWDFLITLEKRYSDSWQKLFAQLNLKQEKDERIIIQFIQQCGDNDILINLHEGLLETRFDYLRIINTEETIAWQGTNKQKEIVPTSKIWATIEKSFALQMANNIRVNSDPFTPYLASKKIDQFTNSHAFFAIKRKSTAPQKTSKMCRLFTSSRPQGEAAFETTYNNHFNKYS